MIEYTGLTSKEINQRGIRTVLGRRGGIEMIAPTYEMTIAAILLQRAIIETKWYLAACDYLELKNSVYGFLNAKTMAGILRTGESGFKRGNAEAAYYVASRYIGRTSERCVVIAMDDRADETLSLGMVSNAYRSAFHTVFDGMELAIRAVKDDIEKGLAQ